MSVNKSTGLAIRFIIPGLFSLPFFLFLGILEGDWLSGVLFFMGLYLGTLFLYADERWFFDYYQEPEKNKFEKQKEMLVGNATASVEALKNAPRLITRSTIFLMALVPLTIFVLTSSGSLLGIGMVLGIQIGLVEEIWRYWKMSVQVQSLKVFQERFLYDLKKALTAQDIRYFAVGCSAFLLLSVLLAVL